ncbi:MAG: tetratricopeptide repeat protein, partial [Cyanobacteria bacterium P01_D01_bin.156]
MLQSRQLLNTVFMVTSLGLLFPQIAQAALVERAEPTWSESKLEKLKKLELLLAKSTQVAQTDPRKAEADQLRLEGIEQAKRSDWQAALATWQQTLAIYQNIGDRVGEAKTLNNIGIVNRLLGNYPEALDYYARSLVVTQEIGDRATEAKTLNNIGIVNRSLGNYAEALDYYAQSLVITQEIGDRDVEAQTLNNIGVVNHLLGNYPEALDYYAQSLAIKQEIGDRASEAPTLNNIGEVNRSLGNYLEALDYYAQSLVITQEIGDRASEAQTLNNIGLLNRLLGNYLEALDYYAQSLVITQEIGDRASEAQTLNNIGNVNRLLGNYPEALDYYAQSLVSTQEIGDRAGEANTLANIGFLFETQEIPVLAITFLKQAINIYEDIRSGIQSLEQASQENFKAKNENNYRALADLLLQQNRVLEAQRVIDLLKVQELDDTLRGVRGNSSTASGVPLLEEEKTLLARSQQIFQQGISISQELGELRQIPLADRTTANNERIFSLENQQSELLTAFLDFVASPEVANLIANLSDIAKQGDLVTKLASDEFINLRNNLADIENAALIYPLILENRLELVLVTSSGPPTHYPITVDEDTLRDTVFEFQQALRDKTSTPEPLAQKLYDWIIPTDLEAALEQQGIDTILYAP